MKTPGEPTLIYDGDCTFCCKCVERLKLFLGQRLRFLSSQSCAQDFSEITAEQFAQSVHFIGTDGQRSSAAQAIFQALSLRWESRPLLWAYRWIPFFADLTEKVYRWVAQNREPISKVDQALSGMTGVIPSYSMATWLFLRGMALVYLLAFLSLLPQVTALVGPEGIWPAQLYLNRVFEQWQLDALLQLPTVFWLGSSDLALLSVCILGCLLALSALCGWGGASLFLVLWFLYLSLVQVGGPFLSFQWDHLLLEAGFLCFLLSPWHAQPLAPSQLRPSFLARWLILFLLFRLMFASGLVKLASGDPTWANLTALTYHYETQPLPSPLAYFLHHTPLWFHQGSALIMFSVELILPFLIFCPRRPQLVAASAFLSLQLLIALSGNYGFFNLLSSLLCLLLIDDKTWTRLPLSFFRPNPNPDDVKTQNSVQLLPYALLVLLLSTVSFSSLLLKKSDWPDWIQKIRQIVAPYRSINHYGLFAVMTTTRREIMIEGSNDGIQWLPYRFKWKPDELTELPGWVAPHQPRLDWQMWFAALGTAQQNPWFIQFCRQLLLGNEKVLSLLDHNPFPDNPPRYLRANLLIYTFAPVSERTPNGPWWQAQPEQPYLRPISLRP
ncbi:MAG: DUF393 domain-containing protein [Blastochloris sp.]|nr:DUF393 domain-containing protein [Blastochloris sp.]